MMLPLTSASPTTAERIRSACARAGGALLAVEREDPVATPIHHLLPDGSFAVALPAGEPAVQASLGRRRCWSWPTTRPFRCANRSARWFGFAAACGRSLLPR